MFSNGQLSTDGVMRVSIKRNHLTCGRLSMKTGFCTKVKGKQNKTGMLEMELGRKKKNHHVLMPLPRAKMVEEAVNHHN